MVDVASDNLADSSPIIWLRGDEIVLFPDGHLAKAVEKLTGDSATGLGPVIREAIAVWPNGKELTPDSLNDFNDRSLREQIKSRIRNLARDGRDYIRIRENAPYVWNMPYQAGQINKMRVHSEASERAVIPTLNLISRDAKAWLNRPATQKAFTKDEATESLLVDKETFRRDQATMIQQPVFTSELAQLFASDGIPIMIVSDLNKVLKKDSGTVDTSFFASYGDGLIFSHSTLAKLGASDNDNYHVIRNISRGLIWASASAIGLTKETLGLQDNEQWKRITAEYKQNAEIITNPEQWKIDTSAPGDYSATDILAQIHFALHSGRYDPAEVRKALPESVAMYEKFMQAIKQRTQERQKNPPYNPSRLPPPVAEEHSEVPPVPVTLPSSGTSVPQLDISSLDFAPKPFTNNPREQELIEAAKPFLKEALSETPPCNQFRCHLILTDNNARDNYPIRLTFRNAKGTTKEFTVYTGTGDLDEAIELKKTLQSHVLNHDDIAALYLRLRDDGKREHITQSEAIIPNTAPSSIQLAQSGHYYTANITFVSENGQENEVIIPLGMRYEPQKAAIAAEAERRLAYVQEHLQELREHNRWETLGEVVQHLKHQVITSRQKAGWRVADIQPLDYYGTREVDLGFPASRPQSTIIKSATLRLVEGVAEPNPFWRLHFTITVSGLGKDGQEIKEYHLSQNLHTADGLAAQVRGTQAIESLADDLKRLSTSYPTLRWTQNTHDDTRHVTTTGQLALSFPDGTSLTEPEPQNLFHLLEDMPNPKVNFRVTHHIAPSQNQGKSILTLSVQRGTESEEDLIDFKNRSGKMMCRSFEIDAGDPSAVESLVNAVNSTFRKDIEDAYGNRTDDGKRKTRQEFRTATIENLFNDAVDKKIGNASEKRPERTSQSSAAVGA